MSEQEAPLRGARDPERDYIARTIATVRNHRGADNCWPQWANAFADEIERQDLEIAELRAEVVALREREGAWGTPYEKAMLRRVSDASPSGGAS